MQRNINKEKNNIEPSITGSILAASSVEIFIVIINKLKSEYGLNMTRKVEMEVANLCTYATAMENKGIDKGFKKGMESGLKALVQSLKSYVSDFDELYTAVTKNEDYEKVSREEVMKYYCETKTPVNS